MTFHAKTKGHGDHRIDINNWKTHTSNNKKPTLMAKP
ncbi:hypothetical protein C8N47_103113 [Mangrovibacterium marinum]|uniref:Uncharacterized protein n=1 Tax=Mangrovibacterium marinum TaxID=1639118 RepID=A0A2T5C4N6_9BACT|nr:hypothetical protein C8N47_103113 [Mangrovibacterium marinum]